MSQHIQFEEISGRNFQSFKEFSLPIKPGKHLVSGINGAGKSTLFNSVAWTCFKHNLREKNPSRHGEGECLTSVKFTKAQDRYQIDRYLGDSTLGNKVKLFQNDEDLTFRKSFSSEEETRKVLGISADVFNTTIILSQGLPLNFSKLPPTIKKSLIEDYLGFSIWSDYRTQFSFHLKNLNLNREAILSDYSYAHREMMSLDQKVEVQKAIDGINREALRKAILESKEELIQYRAKRPYLMELRAKASTHSFTEIQDSIRHSNETLGYFENRKRVLSSVLEKKICGECEQAYPEDKAQLAKWELSLVIKKIESVTALLRDRQSELEEVRNLDLGLSRNELDQIEESVTLNKLLDKEITHSDENLTKLVQDLEVSRAEVTDLSRKLVEFDSRIESTKYLDGLVLPSSKFRTKVLENYLEYINSLLDQISPQIFDELKVRLVIDEKNNGIGFEIHKGQYKRTYEGLSGGEQRKLDLSCIFTFQKYRMENSGVSSNMLVFDEIFDHIDSNGLDSILCSLDVLFPESSSIYVISHNLNLESRFSSMIKVIQEKDSSLLDLTKYSAMM